MLNSESEKTQMLIVFHIYHSSARIVCVCVSHDQQIDRARQLAPVRPELPLARWLRKEEVKLPVLADRDHSIFLRY